MKKYLLVIVAIVAIGAAVTYIHDARITKQRVPVHVTARIDAVHDPAPSSYSSGSNDRVVSGLKVSILSEEEYKKMDEISLGLYNQLWFAPWESGGHFSMPNVYLIPSSRILKNNSPTSVSSLRVGDEVVIAGGFMLYQGGVIVAEQVSVK